MAGESSITTDHDEIRRWAQERGGTPVIVRDTTSLSPGEGYLHLEFPGYSRGENAEKVSWDQFFSTFEERNLAFQYQEERPTGTETYNFKLIDRDDAGNANRAKPREERGRDRG
jgi:hypothetical protein